MLRLYFIDSYFKHLVDNTAVTFSTYSCGGFIPTVLKRKENKTLITISKNVFSRSGTKLQVKLRSLLFVFKILVLFNFI